MRNYVPQIVTPYRIDIQQGNFVTQDMVDKLAVGQTRDQVRFILGTPLLADVFHANRWDYVFRSSKGWNEPEKRKLVVHFDAENRVAKWVADVPAPAPAADAAPAAKPAAPARPDASTGSAAGQGVVGGVSNLAVGSAGIAAPAEPLPGAAAAPAAASPPPSPPSPSPSPSPPAQTLAPGASAAPPAPMAAAAPAVPVAETVPPSAQSGAAPAAPGTGTATPSAAPQPPVAAVDGIAPRMTPRTETADQGVGAVLAALETWRSAWAARDAEKYLAMYAPAYKPGAGLSRAKWETLRRDRLKRASFIVVKVVDPQVSVAADGTASAVFTQVYESDVLKESGRKKLAMVRQSDGNWRIRDEVFEK